MLQHLELHLVLKEARRPCILVDGRSETFEPVELNEVQEEVVVLVLPIAVYVCVLHLKLEVLRNLFWSLLGVEVSLVDLPERTAHDHWELQHNRRLMSLTERGRNALTSHCYCRIEDLIQRLVKRLGFLRTARCSREDFCHSGTFFQVVVRLGVGVISAKQARSTDQRFGRRDILVREPEHGMARHKFALNEEAHADFTFPAAEVSINTPNLLGDEVNLSSFSLRLVHVIRADRHFPSLRLEPARYFGVEGVPTSLDYLQYFWRD